MSEVGVSLKVTLELDGKQARALRDFLGNTTGSVWAEALETEVNSPEFDALSEVYDALSGIFR